MMFDMYGQYGKFIDEHRWDYDGAWSYYRFNMEHMTVDRSRTVEDGTTEIERFELAIYNGKLCYKTNKDAFGLSIQEEYKRYMHWLFERVVLLEEQDECN
jgi:hypothetical protein